MSGELDEARERCLLLLQILTAAKVRATNDPLGSYCQELGIVQAGDKKMSAIKKVSRIFDELDGLLAHLTLIDMVSSLERAFKSRLGTALGEARKTLRENHNRELFHAVREGLVSEPEHFQGLRGMEALLGSRLADEVKKKLNVIRLDRNLFAHGTDVSRPPSIDIRDAYEALRVVADTFSGPTTEPSS